MYHEWAGWVPAIILPLSTLIQWIKLLRSPSVEGVSRLSWFLFGWANLGAYLFVDRPFSLQAILAFLLSATLDFCIVITVMTKSRKTFQVPGN